jgi:drug/metabolite transporter (DMT)-like permease
VHPVVKAVLWMAGTLVAFSIMAIAGRELSREVGTFEILLFRSIVGLPVVAAIILWRDPRLFRTQRLGLHIVRNSAHFAGQFGWMYGVAAIPLAEVFAIEFTLPIWTTLFAALLLGERFTRARGLAMVFGFIGMLVILRPGTAAIHPAALAVLFSAMIYAFAHTITKRLAGIEAPLTILFYMTLIQLIIGTGPALYEWVTPAPRLWLWALAIGLTAMVAQYCLTRALALADASVVMPMDFLRLPLIATVGALVYHEAIDPSLFAGALLILTGVIINVQAERRRVAA